MTKIVPGRGTSRWVRLFGKRSQRLEQKISDLEKQLKQKSIAQRTVYIGGRPIYIWTDEGSESNIDRRDINVATAIQLQSNALSGLPVIIEAKDGDGWTKMPDHPAEKLVTQPNPFHSQIEIVTHIIQCLTCKGDAYFIKEKENMMGEYNRLWPVPPWMMKLEYDITGRPAHYIYDPSKTKRRYKIEQVLHMRWYHMSNPFTGTSPMTPAMKHLNNKEKAVEYNSNFFKNGGSPEMVFVDEGSLDMQPEQQEQFLKQWDNRHKGTDNAHKRAVMPAGIKPMVIGSTLKDMLFGDMQKLDREQIYGFLQIPPSEAGIYEYANYANSMIQKKTFWENCLVPKKRLIEININRQVIWPQWGDQYRVILDTSDVAALQEDKQIQANATATLYNAGIYTLNEARNNVGKEPVEDGETFKPAPTGGLFSMNNNNDDDNKPGDGDKTGVLNSLGIKVKSPSPRDNKWLIFDQKATGAEPGYVKTINRYFDNQLSRVITALKESSVNGAMFNTWVCKAYYYLGSKESTDKDLPEDVRRFFDLSAEDIALADTIKPVIKETVNKAGSSFFNEYNIDLDFNVNNEQVVTLINRLTNRIKKINDSSYDQLRGLLKEAYEEGWPLSTLEKEIRLKYQKWTHGEKLTQPRASAIARTETGAAVNGGTLIGYKQGGAEIVEQKEWVTSLDSATRDSHAMLDGQKVLVKDRFSNGLDYPLDPAGPAEEVINCRCTIIPVTK